MRCLAAVQALCFVHQLESSSLQTVTSFILWWSQNRRSHAACIANLLIFAAEGRCGTCCQGAFSDESGARVNPKAPKRVLCRRCLPAVPASSCLGRVFLHCAVVVWLGRSACVGSLHSSVPLGMLSSFCKELSAAYGGGSKPMVPLWARCTTHFSLF